MTLLEKEIIIIGSFIMVLGIGICWLMTWDNFISQNQMYVSMFGVIIIIPLIMWLIYSLIKKDQ